MKVKIIIIGAVLLQLISVKSSELNSNLTEEFSKLTSYEILDQKYKEIKGNKSSSGTKSQSISEIFAKRLQTLQETINQVKNLTSAVPPELGEDGIMWARDLNESDCNLQERGPYKQRICLERSGVHIPIDIFRGDKQILRTASWTSLMDKVWINNMAKHPELLWQYFGSTSGVFRFYPGTDWPLRSKDKEGENVDLYDVRRRSWYVEGMSLPKDMLILIDSSGSSQGQALALMKHITRSLLETLDENDQINILTFPQETNEITRIPCFPTFVKATFRNKQFALDYTKKIISTGIANFSKALEAAFLFFENATSNVSETFSGSHCNQMIMLLTDGGNEKPREVLRKYNTFQRVRIFTYLIGPISTDAPAIKWIAEKSRGQFYQIPSIVAIRSQTQEYVRYLSDTKANLVNASTWSSASIDYLNNELVVSITAPLFNSTAGEENNNTILGVLGIDVPVKEFINAMPNLGEYGYFFIINSQGFVLYHPRLLNMREEFLNVDILDLETDLNMPEIRANMIDGKSGSLSVRAFDDLLDEHHANIKKRTYTYEPIQGTEFSLCKVEYGEVGEEYKEMKITGAIDPEIFFTIENTNVIFNDKNYCPEGDADNMTEIEQFVNQIVDLYKCDDRKLRGLIFDILQTNSTGEAWLNGEDDEDVDDSRVLLKFIETPNIFRTYPENSSEEFDYFLEGYQKHKERISKTKLWLVSVYDEDHAVDNQTSNILLIARRITSGNSQLAVIGALVAEEWLQDTAFDELVEPDNTTDVISFLIDDGGIIITTNIVHPLGMEYVGRFFGEDGIEGELMKDMIVNGIYDQHFSTGYLASCAGLAPTAFSPSLRSFLPFVEVLSFRWWMSVLSAQFYWFSSIFHIITSVIETIVSGEVILYEPEDHRETEYCAKDFFKYSFGSASQNAHAHSITCGNCTKSYTTEMLPDINLLLVSVTSEDGCRCPPGNDSTALPFKPSENCVWENLRSIFYRKQVPCRPFFSEKEESYSSSSKPSASWILLVAMASFGLMIDHALFY